MDETLKQIIIYVVAFVGGYFSRYLQPRARVVHWFPGWVTFPVPVPGNQQPQTLNISTHTLTVQNIGMLPAHRVEIVHGQALHLFRLTPPMNYSQGVTPSGEHVITINSLAPREWVAIQVLTLGPFPPLRSVRSVEGPSVQVTTQQTFVLSKWKRRVFGVLLLLGAATAIYWGWRLATKALPAVWNFIWQ